MLFYIVKRIIYMIPTLFGMSLISFLIIQLPPGDYLKSMLSSWSDNVQPIDPAQIERLKIIYGFDDPFYVQYWKWISGILFRGDFGYSFEWNQPVSNLIWDRMGSTLGISLASLLFVWAVSLPIGIYSAVRRHSVGDHVFTLLGFLGLAIPNFIFALTLMYVSYKFLGQSVGGLYSPQFVDAPWTFAKFVDLLAHLWIPIIVIGTAALIRILRANLTDELSKPYVTTARAKGLPEYKVILKYPVRIALNPFVSAIGWVLPHLVSGVTITAIVLNLPTAGPLLLGALVKQDMYLAGSFILLLSALTLVGMLVSDLLLALLDPRMTVKEIIADPLIVSGTLNGKAIEDKVASLLTLVGLDPQAMERYPHAFSGGQRQRIGIARALALDPRIIIADEATSALDLSIRSQILDLLLDIQKRLSLSFIFISHDISVVRYFCDRVAVMHRGKIVEIGDAEQICTAPAEAYTRSLISAVPNPDPRNQRMLHRQRFTAPTI